MERGTWRREKGKQVSSRQVEGGCKGEGRGGEGRGDGRISQRGCVFVRSYPLTHSVIQSLT